MRFGGFYSYEKFEEGWGKVRFPLPLDWKIANLYISGMSKQDTILLERVPKQLRQAVHNLLFKYERSYLFDGLPPPPSRVEMYKGRRPMRKRGWPQWTTILALAQLFDIDPGLLVDEELLYSYDQVKNKWGHMYGFRYHKLLFASWQQGLPISAIIPPRYLSNKEQAERERRFIVYLLRPREETPDYGEKTKINFLLEVGNFLGIPMKDLFSPLRRVELTCFSAVSNALGLMDDKDVYLLYGIGELLAKGRFADTEELKRAIGVLIDRRSSWG